MEPIRVGPDAQTLRLLKTNAWSNAVCILLLIAINAVNFLRAGGSLGSEASDGMQWGGGLSPVIVLALSAVLSAYLAILAVQANRTRLRLTHVFLSVEGQRVRGVSLGNPMESDADYPNGRPFDISLGEIARLSVEALHVTKQQTVPCLVIRTEGDTLRVPALADTEGVCAALSERMRRNDREENVFDDGKQQG